jgi:hypothetical protein
MARRTLVLDQPVESTEATKKKSRKGIFVGIAILALVPVVGSTFAANIGINSGSPVEFGQGVTTVTACAPEVRVTPAARYNSSDNKFYLSQIKIENAAAGTDTMTSLCGGKTFRLVVRDNAGAALYSYAFTLNSNSTLTDLSSSASTEALDETSNGTDGIITIIPSVDHLTASGDAGDLATIFSKITIETS